MNSIIEVQPTSVIEILEIATQGTAGANGLSANRTGGAFSLLLTDEETKLLNFDNGTYSFSLEYEGRKDDLGGGKVKISNP